MSSQPIAESGFTVDFKNSRLYLQRYGGVEQLKNAIDHISNDSQRITSIYFGNDSNITDAGLKHLPSGITSIYFGDFSKITDAGLKYLPSGITLIDFGNFSKITDAGLKYLPSGITSIVFGRNSNITDAGLNDLPSGVTSIVFGYESKITDAGIRSLRQRGITLYNSDMDIPLRDRVEAVLKSYIAVDKHAGSEEYNALRELASEIASFANQYKDSTLDAEHLKAFLPNVRAKLSDMFEDDIQELLNSKSELFAKPKFKNNSSSKHLTKLDDLLGELYALVVPYDKHNYTPNAATVNAAVIMSSGLNTKTQAR